MDSIANLVLPQTTLPQTGAAAPSNGIDGAFAAIFAQACTVAPAAPGDTMVTPADALPSERLPAEGEASVPAPSPAAADVVVVQMLTPAPAAIAMPVLVPEPAVPPPALSVMPAAREPGSQPSDAVTTTPITPAPGRGGGSKAALGPIVLDTGTGHDVPTEPPAPIVMKADTETATTGHDAGPARTPLGVPASRRPTGRADDATPTATDTATPDPLSSLGVIPFAAAVPAPATASTASRQTLHNTEASTTTRATPSSMHPAEILPGDPKPAPGPPLRPLTPSSPIDTPSRGMAPPRPAAETPAQASSTETQPPVVPFTSTLHEARAPDAASPAAAPPPATPARQLAPVLVSVAIAGGTAKLSVTLDPAELGRVEISIDRTGDTAEVRVFAERPETLMLLQRDQRELDRALTQAGMGTDGRGLSFSWSDGGSGNFGTGRDGDREGLARDMRGGSSSTGAVDGAALAEPPPRRLLSLIDLAV